MTETLANCAPVCALPGVRCPRPVEVSVHLVNPRDGSTVTRNEVCAVHAIDAALMAFVDSTTVRWPMTVILSPLPAKDSE